MVVTLEALPRVDAIARRAGFAGVSEELGRRVREEIARGELLVKTTDQERSDSTMHTARRNDARGKAVALWLEKLRSPATRAARVA